MIENYTDFITLSAYFASFGYFFYRFLSEISKQQIQFIYTSDYESDKAQTHELYKKFSNTLEYININSKNLLIVVDKLDIETDIPISFESFYSNSILVHFSK